MLAAEATKQRKRAEAAQQRAEQARMAASDPALAPPPQHVSSGANSGGNGALDGLAMTGTAGTAPPGPPWQLGVGPVVRLQERLPATRMLTAILVLWVASIASGLMLHTGASGRSYRKRETLCCVQNRVGQGAYVCPGLPSACMQNSGQFYSAEHSSCV